MSNLFLSFLDGEAAEVEFDAGSDTADTELASDAIEVIDAVNEVGEGSAATEDAVELVEVTESLIATGQAVAKGQPITAIGLYMAEQHVSRLPVVLFESSLGKLEQTAFESIVTDESAIRQRALAYASESFLSDAKTLVKKAAAWVMSMFDKLLVLIKRVFLTASKMKKSLEDIKSDLSKEGDYTPTSEKEVSVNAGWLNDGKKVNPSDAVKTAKEQYTKAAGAAKTLTGELVGKYKEIVAAEGDFQKTIEEVEVKRSSSFSTLASISGHKLSVSKGRLVVGPAPSIEKKVIPAFSKADLVKFVDAAIALAAALEKHKDTIKEAEKAKSDEVKAINDAAKELDNAADADSAKIATLRRKLTALTKVSASTDIASLNAVSGAAFAVLFASVSFAKSNKAALAKKKSN
jgi:predicted  nucleic acid-binding Zn-ribbon protein